MNENITILGLDDFNSIEKRKIIDYIEKYSEKIFRDVEGILIVHAKRHEKDGKRVKYSFHVKIESPETLLGAKDDDWILAKALHKVFTKVENEIQHKFKLEGHKNKRVDTKLRSSMKKALKG